MARPKCLSKKGKPKEPVYNPYSAEAIGFRQRVIALQAEIDYAAEHGYPPLDRKEFPEQPWDQIESDALMAAAAIQSNKPKQYSRRTQ